MSSTPSRSMRKSFKTSRIIPLAAATLLLGACSTMSDIPAGTPLAEVQASHGAPSIECPQPDGSRYLVWSTQPMGQYAWGAPVTQDGRVGQIEQVLSDSAFRRVELGVWDGDQLVCAFGPPAETSVVGPPGSLQRVWSYRYRQSGAWNSLMHFYISEEGKVTRMHPGPDPMYDRPEWMFM